MKTWKRKGLNHRFYEKMILLALLLSSLQKKKCNSDFAALKLLFFYGIHFNFTFKLYACLYRIIQFFVCALQCSVSLRVAQ